MTAAEETSDGTELVPGWSLRFERVDEAGKVDICLYVTRDGTEECAKRVTKPRDFYETPNHYQNVGNEFRDAVEEESVDGDKLKESVLEVSETLREKSDEIEKALAQDLASETAARVQQETEEVVFFKTPDGLTVRITLDCDETGIKDTLELSHTILSQNAPQKAQSAYFAATASPLEFSEQDWRDIKTYWKSIAEIVRDDDIKSTERVAEEMAHNLDVEPMNDAEALTHGVHNAYLQSAEEVNSDEYVAEESDYVLWVRSPALTELKRQYASQGDPMTELKEALVSLKFLNTIQNNTRSGVSVYAFDPGRLDINIEAVLADGDEEDGVGGVEV